MHVLHDDLAILNALPYEMVARLDMLASPVEHWIFAELNHRLVVHEHSDRSSFLPEQVG